MGVKRLWMSQQPFFARKTHDANVASANFIIFIMEVNVMKKVMLMAMVLVVFAGSAQAVIEYRLAFTTSVPRDATATDIAVYNAYIQNLATAAGLPGTDWRVIGSTAQVDARDNTGTNPNVDGVGVPIYLVDGITKVADDNADLWDGDIDHIIDQDENGGTGYPHLWCYTGTRPDGTKSPGPNNAGGPLGNVGEVSQGNGGLVDTWIWRQWTSDPHTTILPLYGMSEILPEPTTIALLGLGGLTLLRRRRNG